MRVHNKQTQRNTHRELGLHLRLAFQASPFGLVMALTSEQAKDDGLEVTVNTLK